MAQSWPWGSQIAIKKKSLVTSRHCRFLQWADLYPISMYIGWLEFSSLEMKYNRFRNRDEGTWQKPLEILTTKDC